MSSLNKNIHTVKCSTEGCNKPVKAKGLCRAHYVSPAMLKMCATEGCDKPVKAKGLCIAHYVSPAMLKTCSMKKCDRKILAKNLCRIHYLPPGRSKLCTIENCDRNAYCKGFCNVHYTTPAQTKQCSIQNCKQNVFVKNMCKLHSGRVHSKGIHQPPELNQQTTHGYIIHDKTGTPVYVGITCNFDKRMYNHETCQPWGTYVNIPEQPTVAFDNREQASEWEQQTIAKLTQTTPLFNSHLNEHWSLDYEHNLLERTIDIHNQHTMLQSMVESHT